MTFIRAVLVSLITWQARAVLRRYKPQIIAVTGSVGKTTTKDAIFAAISPHLHVRKSAKSFNSDIGVPLTILGCDNPWSDPVLWIAVLWRGLMLIVGKYEYPAWLVLEVGADRPGDIRSVARWLKPKVVVITAVPEVPVHVEYFPSPQALLREKASLAEYLAHGGRLILNGDDTRVRALKSEYRGVTVLFGFEPQCDFCADHQAIQYEGGYPSGMYFRLEHSGSSIPMTLRGALGTPRIYAVLAALAVADALDIDTVTAAESLREWSPPGGRMRIIRGKNNSTIIDDTYNSSPIAVLSALDTLKEIVTSGRKTAVLGDMLELGKFSADAHKDVGQRAAECTDSLVTIGFRARGISEAALDGGLGEGNIREYEHDEAARAGAELARDLHEGDVVLVKGSQSMRMERTVEALMAEPERASELLVRQDAEWLAKP